MHSLLLTNIFSEWKWAGLGIRAFALLLFCSFALLLYCSIALLLFRSFALCSFAQIKEQLWAICSGCKRAMGTICSRSLMTKEQPWVNCSHHSLQKSNREGFAQVAHDKRAMAAIRFFSGANRSFVLLLPKNEQIAQKTDEQSPNPWNWGDFVQQIIENFYS